MVVGDRAGQGIVSNNLVAGARAGKSNSTLLAANDPGSEYENMLLTLR